MLNEKDHLIKNVDVLKTRINIVDLIKKAQMQKKKDRRKALLMTTAAISVIAVSGLFISH